MPWAPKILLVDDDPLVLRGVGGLLRDEGYRIAEARNTTEARAALEETDPPAMMVLDIRMPGESGLQFLAQLPQPTPIPVVVMSGEASAGEAAQALKLGATDFVEKPPTPERLLIAVKNALALRALSEESQRLRLELARPGSLVGESAALAKVRELVAQVGPRDAIVLVTGETGTGKERVARALHHASGRRGRLVAINCAAIPATLLESELFGHERGAFTGATARHLGRFEQADQGTLLLDEIGDMPLELQAKLLRVLEGKEIERLGATRATPVDVRIVAATHRDLPAAIAAGRFRQDLFYRLNVFPIPIPPLRERPDDLVPLVRAFAAELRGGDTRVELTPEAEAALRAYPWPGNVRELRNFVERSLLLQPPGTLRIGTEEVASLNLVRGAAVNEGVIGIQLGEKGYRELVEDFERAIIESALGASGRNIAAAARMLKLDRGNLYRRIKALGIPTSGEE